MKRKYAAPNFWWDHSFSETLYIIKASTDERGIVNPAYSLSIACLYVMVEAFVRQR